MSTSLLLLHADPGNWGIPVDNVEEFANSFIYSHAQIANAIGKPFILEETGTNVSSHSPCGHLRGSDDT